jgi:hypothetical protein
LQGGFSQLAEETPSGSKKRFSRRKEIMMAFKEQSDKKKVEIHCQRCKGPMAFEKFYGENDSYFGWHCVICGDILDPVILLHRLSQDANLAIPEKEEEKMALVQKYMSARLKAV